MVLEELWRSRPRGFASARRFMGLSIGGAVCCKRQRGASDVDAKRGEARLRMLRGVNRDRDVWHESYCEFNP